MTNQELFNKMNEAAMSCMSPDQHDLFLKIGEDDIDVYARFFKSLTKQNIKESVSE